MTDTTSFSNALTKQLLVSVRNFHGSENWDTALYGERKVRFRRRVLEYFIRHVNPLLERVGLRVASIDDVSSRFDGVMSNYGDGLSQLYQMLSDEYSKRCLIEVIAYRILGHRHVKLQLNDDAYWKARATAEGLPCSGKKLDSGLPNIKLDQYDLNQLGLPIVVYTNPVAVAHQLILQHYCYERSSPPVGAASGDYVIDAGAGWGDTALLFAQQVGEKGHVYSFEVEPANLRFMEKNLELNSELAGRISVIPRPLWRDSQTDVTFQSRGPATSVQKNNEDSAQTSLKTICIDEFCDDLPQVDFIKMDIEGAEVPALEGARKTILKHRPKMALSLYHSLSDFVEIPRYLASLGVKWRYYLGHYTIHNEETVLFVLPE